MSASSIRLFLFMLLAGWQCAWADRAAEVPAASPAALQQQLDAAPPRGLLYRISKNGRAAHLFGTLHVGRPDFYPLDRTTTRALAQASELVVELDASQADRMQAGLVQYALLKDARTLDGMLPDALRQRLHAQLDAFGIPRQTMQPFKPWMAMFTLLVGAFHSFGYDAAYATDLYLIGLAKGFDKKIGELEGIDYQFRLFDSLTLDEQLAFLDETLVLLESRQMQADTVALVSAWLAGDAQKLQQLSLKSLHDSPRSAPWMKQKLFSERNLRMADRIDRMLGEGRTPFVAVGALHLTGEDGLPALLEKRGYRIDNLYSHTNKETP